MIQAFVKKIEIGFYKAVESFRLLLNNLTILSYYFISFLFFLIGTALFLLLAGLVLGKPIIFGIILDLTKSAQALFHFSNDLYLTHDKTITYLIPETGGLIYLGQICALFLNILARTIIGATVISHAHAIIHGHTITGKEIWQLIQNRWKTILGWSFLTGAITLAVNAPSVSEAYQNKYLVYSASLCGIIWLLISFYVLPVITLTKTTIIHSLRISVRLLKESYYEVIGGLFWIVTLYIFALLAAVLITEYLLPSELQLIFTGYFFLGINTFFVAALLIFKTYCTHEKILIEKTANQ